MHLDKMLDDLLLIFVRCLLWHKKAFSPRPRPEITASSDPEKSIPADAFDHDEDEADPERLKQVMEPLPALLDYFTALYGLFPANLLYFLTSPVQWLQSYVRRQARRQSRSSSSSSRSLGQPAERSRYGADSSTSGGEEFPNLDDDEEGQDPGNESDAEGLNRSSSLRRNAGKKSRPHGKGRRSKLKKQKKDASTTAKKEKEAQRQKERERRRRSANFLSANPAAGEGVDDQGPESSGMVQQLSGSSVSAPGDDGAAMGAKVRIAVPEDKTDVSGEGMERSDSTSEQSSEDDDEYETDTYAVELDDTLLRIDWDLVRILSQVRI